MPNWKFFFSYARNDRSPYLDGFFELLREEVMHKTAVKSPTEACFRDTENIDLGKRWTSELINALQTTKVLVCLYTPSYFASPYCGKEVFVFQSRITEYKKKKIETPDVILPILWETPRTFSIPSSLKEIQFTPPSCHEDYPKNGLLTFSRNDDYKNAYLLFIEQLALKIQEISSTVDLPECKFEDISSIPDAFKINQENDKETTLFSVSNPNPKQTRIVFAAGVKSEVAKIKAKTEGYSDKSEYWKPFYPETDEEIGIISQQIISDMKFHYLPIQFSENLPEIIREAEDNNCVAVLIVDPWSLNLEKYKKPISKFNELQFINSAIIVIWNKRDDETILKKDELNSNLFSLLFRCFEHNTPGISEGVTNTEEFKNIMKTAIDEARAMIIKRAKPFQIIKTETISMPLLTVPGAPKNG